MFASGTIAPEVSTTVPLTSPVIIWAGARMQNRGTKTAAHKQSNHPNLLVTISIRLTVRGLLLGVSPLDITLLAGFSTLNLFFQAPINGVRLDTALLSTI